MIVVVAVFLGEGVGEYFHCFLVVAIMVKSAADIVVSQRYLTRVVAHSYHSNQCLLKLGASQVEKPPIIVDQRHEVADLILNFSACFFIP